MQTIILESNSIIQEDLVRIASADLPWDMLRNKAVMVTGGGGFLAAYLVKALLTASAIKGLNTKVICLVRGNPKKYVRLGNQLDHPDLQWVVHDITRPLPADFPAADYIVHSASQASPKYYGSDPVGTLLANSAGTQNLLEYSRFAGTQKFMFFSSGEVYGTPLEPDHQICETDYGYLDPMNVRSCYAESKRLGETLCAAWTHQYGLHTSVVRPFHTYGPGMALDDGRVFADFVADIVAGRDIELKSDGLAKRPFCYIADATLGFLSVLLNGATAEAYNVANPYAEISMRDLANMLTGLFPERALSTHFTELEAEGGYLKSPVHRSCPSIRKMEMLGWAPSVGLEPGFRRTIQSYAPLTQSRQP